MRIHPSGRFTKVSILGLGILGLSSLRPSLGGPWIPPPAGIAPPMNPERQPLLHVCGEFYVRFKPAATAVQRAAVCTQAGGCLHDYRTTNRKKPLAGAALFNNLLRAGPPRQGVPRATAMGMTGIPSNL